MDTLQQHDSLDNTITSTQFKFNATGGEYFRIWIVNLLLSIVTLGIYSAWAKVRRNQYFYSSTELAGSSFEYHGNPIAILKGRIAALVLFIAYNVALKTSPVAGVVMIVAMGAILPWLIWKSLQFKLYNSSYRGIRFGFDGSAAQAYLVFLGWPLLNAFTLGLLSPFVHQRLKKFQHTESRYGTSHFAFHGSVGGFYRTYALFFAILLGGSLLLFFVLLSSVIATIKTNPVASVGSIILLVVISYGWLFTIFPLFLTMIQNLIWNNTSLQRHRFSSSLTWGRSTFIMLTNLLGVIFTLGLFMPFAQVRWLKYRLEAVSLQVAGSLDEFVTDTQQQVTAAGEGMVDLLDFDLSM